MTMVRLSAVQQSRLGPHVLESRLNGDLRIYRKRGAIDSAVHDLDALLIAGRCLSEKGTDPERVREIVTTAIDGFHKGKEHWQAARLWFGIAVETQLLSPTDRSIRAAHALSKKSYETFRRHDSNIIIAFLAKQIAIRYEGITAGSIERDIVK